MRLLTRLAILFYVAIISTVCGMIVLFVSHVVPWQDVHYLLELIYSSENWRMGVGITAGVLIFLSFLFARLIVNRQQKERTIAFDNPSGRVSISLAAMEDLIRRQVTRYSEIKEVRPDIIATKKGLDVNVRLILKTDAHIPELTGRLQESIKSKIQDTIGLEGTVTVKIHVVKIVSDSKRDKNSLPEKSEPTVPFPGYRA